MPVDLAVWVPGQFRKLVEGGRKHVFRKLVQKPRAQQRGIQRGERFEKKRYLVPVLVVEHACAADLRQAEHGRLDLAQFDPVTLMLYLEIFSADVHDFPALVPVHEIAGPIDPFRITGVERILNKSARCLLGVVPITERQGTSANA